MSRAHTLLHNGSLLFILYYEYIAHSLLAITIFAFAGASHSDTTVIHFSTRIVARAITLSISLQYEEERRLEEEEKVEKRRRENEERETRPQERELRRLEMEADRRKLLRLLRESTN